jgi:hypothetical protein
MGGPRGHVEPVRRRSGPRGGTVKFNGDIGDDPWLKSLEQQQGESPRDPFENFIPDLKDDKDTIYYIRVSKKKSGTKWLSGPYFYQQIVVDKIHEFLALELCRDGRREFQRTIDRWGLKNYFTEYTCSLPDADSMTIELITETNDKVAEHLKLPFNGRESNYVYRLEACYASVDAVKRYKNGEKIQSDVKRPMKAYLSLEDANVQAQRLVRMWSKDRRVRSIEVGLNSKDGTFWGFVEGWAEDRKGVKVEKVWLEAHDSGRLRAPFRCKRSMVRQVCEMCL